MKPGRTLVSCAAHQEAKAAISCDDGRPAGWTEGHALAFIAEGFVAEPEAFAKDFCEGDWLGIKRAWPGFAEFVQGRS